MTPSSDSCPTPGTVAPSTGRLALRVALGDGRILDADEEPDGLLGRPVAELVGHRLDELWPEAERAAIAARFEDAVLLGADRFGALALLANGASPMWVTADARFRYDGGQRLDIVLQPVGRDAAPGPHSGTVNQGADAGEDHAPARSDRCGTSADASGGSGAAPPTARAAEGCGAPTEARPIGAPADGSSAAPAATAAGRPADGRNAATAATATSPPAERRSAPASATPAWRSPAQAPSAGATLAALGGSDPSLATVIDALAAAGVAALAVGSDGRVVSATSACEALLGRPIARIRGGQLTALVALSAGDAAALDRARADGWRQTVPIDLGSAHRGAMLAWIPAGRSGTGYALLLADAARRATSDAERLQTRLVTFVAHDVRDLIASIYSGLHNLARELGADAPQRPTLERLIQDSSKASRIVDDVVAVSRQGRLTRMPLRLADVLRETTVQYRARAAAAGIEVRESYAPDVRVLADLGSMERAFGNLVQNALEATPHAGTLTITTRLDDRPGPGVRVSVADTGMGIPPEIQSNLFEPFVSGKAAGTGLGLASAQRIVADHGGQIHFETELGSGTTFHVWLPRLTDEAPTAPANDAPAEA